MEWISVKDRLPPLSYIESGDGDASYEAIPVLVWAPDSISACNPEGNQCVAYLVQEQDEEKWSFEDYSWECYVPSGSASIQEIDFETFTHWKPLPEPPSDNNLNESNQH